MIPTGKQKYMTVYGLNLDKPVKLSEIFDRMLFL